MRVRIDDLAVPEISLNKVRAEQKAEEDEEASESEIEYGTAMPEIHFRRGRKENKKG